METLPCGLTRLAATVWLRHKSITCSWITKVV
nr:MAG TPA: hypothetical protein [Caudoviricetes sp.]